MNYTNYNSGNPASWPGVGRLVKIRRPNYLPRGDHAPNHNGHIAIVIEHRIRWKRNTTRLTCCCLTINLFDGCTWEYADAPVEAPERTGSEMPNLQPRAIKLKDGWLPQVVDVAPASNLGVDHDDVTVIYEDDTLLYSGTVQNTDESGEKITPKQAAINHAKEIIDKVTAKAFEEWADA